MTTPLARGSRPLLFVVAGALTAATLDVAYACLFWAVKSGVPPSRILQSIASGVLGKASFEGGAGSAALGFALHYFIMFLMASAYYLAARRWRLLAERAVVCGAAYGLFLYGAMHYVVVPLSNASPGAGDPLWVSLSIAVHVLLIGIPLALFARLALQRPATRAAPVKP